MVTVRRFSPPPALALFLTAAAATHWGYSAPQDYFVPWILTLCGLFVVVLIAMNLAALHQSWPATIRRALFMIVLTAIIAVVQAVPLRETGKPAGITAEASEGHLVTVQSVIPGRYYTKIAGAMTGLDGVEIILVILKGTYDLAPGDRFFFYAPLEPLGLGDTADDQFSLSLRRQGFSRKTFIDGDDIVMAEKAEPSLRTRCALAIERRIMRGASDEGSGLLKALFLARRDGLSVKTTALFRKAGIMHLLAASGMHVGMITFLPLLIVRFFALSNAWALVLGGAPLFLYLAITGMPVSLARAGIMFFIYTASRFAVKKISSLQVLFLTGTILIIAMPWELYSPGFQLSFGATLSILLFTDRFLRALPPLPRWIASPLALSLAAQIAVIPLVAWHFQEIALGGVIATLAASPLIALSMFSGALLTVIPSWAGEAIELTGSMIDALFHGTVAIARLTASLGLHYETGNDMIRPMIFSSLLLLPLVIPVIKRLTLAATLTGLSLFVASASIASPSALSPGNEGGPVYISYREGRLAIMRIPENPEALKVMAKALYRNLPRESILVINSTEGRSLARYNRVLRSMPIDECRLEVPVAASPGFIDVMDSIQREKIRLVMKK